LLSWTPTLCPAVTEARSFPFRDLQDAAALIAQPVVIRVGPGDYMLTASLIVERSFIELAAERRHRSRLHFSWSNWPRCGGAQPRPDLGSQLSFALDTRGSGSRRFDCGLGSMLKTFEDSPTRLNFIQPSIQKFLSFGKVVRDSRDRRRRPPAGIRTALIASGSV
jgi:hypothetical protein